MGLRLLLLLLLLLLVVVVVVVVVVARAGSSVFFFLFQKLDFPCFSAPSSSSWWYSDILSSFCVVRIHGQ
jgi:hypothetical protein